ncbi:sigma-54-dependent transcriptional regulator [Microvirga sp. 2TAF3]|uniref:sigma-54-dependent transcriptional regulator n=1 Tax=Microvirga sp. 2TAF3 TaxID=3233014 RepID=UPI003F959332
MPLPYMFADEIRALRQGTACLVSGTEWMRTIRLADRAARSAMPILIEGEPGSGAQALAHAIHDCGERRNRPLIRLHVGESANRETDQAAILLRHLQDANGGTLFIHDIQHLTAEAQIHLLDVLSQQDVAPRDGRRALRLEARIIAATGFALGEEVRQGRFREDLYYRLQVMPIVLRPLRAERSAIADLARAFLIRFAMDEGKKLKGLMPEAANLLSRYDWPGNLRQLENAVFRAVVLADGPVLTPAEFPQIAAHVQGFRVEIPPVPTAIAPAPTEMRMPLATPDPNILSLMGESGEMRTLAELEADAIRFALSHYRGQMSAISRRLGIGRSTLYRKLKELGLSDAAA